MPEGKIAVTLSKYPGGLNLISKLACLLYENEAGNFTYLFQ